MFNFLSLLNPTTVKIVAALGVVGGLIAGGFYLGNSLSQVQAREFELKAMECEKRGREREIEVTKRLLDEEKLRLEQERELTARIEEELKKNGQISKQLEEELKKKKVVTREVIKYVATEIEKTVYRECVIPPSGVSALIQAAREYNLFRAAPANRNN